VAARVQYNSFPKILSAPDIYTTDAFVTAAVAGALENTSRVISVATTAVAPCPDGVGGGSTYNSSVYSYIYIYIQGESWRFLHNDENTASFVYIVYISNIYTRVYNG